jgi:elongation factor P
MNSETFEEIAVPTKIVTVDDKCDWIEEGGEVNLVFFNDKVIELVLAQTMVFQIVETEPNAKGNTASGHTKPAVLSCGATITVPGYLDQGEFIKCDTDKKTFIERAK